MCSNWKTLSQCKGVGSTPIHRLKSDTGLRLTIINVEGPLLGAYLVLATDVDDEDGLPHTLEHLVFLGSEDYPYKGLLDLFANRCFASGTNAWTSYDHTAYNIKTAGSKGMLKILPIYLDHVLYPTLTDDAFLTEIYHINGDGKDGGVVYSEMQGRENAPDIRCMKKILTAAYPDSCYSKESGGLMKNLRNSTSNTKIRNYHKKFYRPENITIIIIGQIACDDVITALKPIENKIMLKRKNEDLETFIKPFQLPLPEIKSTETIREIYPTDSEDFGLIIVGWRGPNILKTQGLYKDMACRVLLKYFTDTPIAPFQQQLIEIKNPYASGITNNVCDSVEPLYMMSLENVPVNRLDETLPTLRECIESIASQSNSINLNRLKIVIESMIRKTLSNLETYPHEAFVSYCLRDALYDFNDQQFEEMSNRANQLKKLLKEDDKFWMSIFSTYFHTNFLSVIGKPSIELMTRMFEEEKERNLKYKETFREEGLKEKNKQLQQAIEYNSRKPPSEIFNIVDNIDSEGMKTFALEMWSSENANCPYFPINELPFYTRIHHINVQFVYITLLMNTDGLNDEQRSYLPLLLELLTQSPYDDGDELKDHSTLIEEIQILTNKVLFHIGVRNGHRFSINKFQQTIFCFFQCEPEKYEEVVKLIWNILRNTKFTKERALIVAQKMLNDVSKIRRQGDEMVSDLANGLILKKECNFYNCCVIRQQKFLKNIITTLEKSDMDYLQVLENMNVIRKLLLAENNIWLHFTANLKNHQFTANPWKLYPITIKTESTLSNSIVPKNPTEDSEFLINKNKMDGKGCIVGIGGLESYNITQYSKGPQSYTHPDIPALSIVLQYFTQTEGPFWRKIRGAGLSYSFSMELKPNLGVIEFCLYEATDAVKAHEVSRSIIESFLKNIVWDDNLLISAKSSLVYDLVEKESSPAKMIENSLMNYFQKVDSKHTMNLIKQVTNVTKDKLTEVAIRWLSHVFDPKTVTLAIVCNPYKIQDTQTSFQKLGFDNLHMYKSIEESHLGD